MMLRTRYTLGILALAACGGDPTGADTGQLSGDYQITGTGTAATGPVTFRVVDQTDERIVLDWIGGVVYPGVPVRDTAQWNESAYRLDWRETAGGSMYIVRFTGTTCTGQRFNALGGSGAWTGCTMTR